MRRSQMPVVERCLRDRTSEVYLFDFVRTTQVMQVNNNPKGSYRT